ncbi:MAG: metal-dependent hydrolase [bacterium]|nr:metal-dependent hydrolase [bacterium]
MELKLTWHGHATWLLETGEHRILIDPFVNENPAATVKADDLTADFVLITHGHFDHVADAASIARRCSAKLIANFEIASWFQQHHHVEDTLGMNLGGSVSLPFGRLKMTVAHHSSQLPDGSYGGNPGGFLLELADRRLYFAGDTALFSDMRQIAAGGIDVAVLPIGDLFTMGPEDSIEAVQLIEPKVVIPAHYNTWPPIEQDVELWASAIREHTGAEPMVLEVGKTVSI